eukprot:3843760-Karenia_brevis.AAC.1
MDVALSLAKHQDMQAVAKSDFHDENFEKISKSGASVCTTTDSLAGDVQAFVTPAFTTENDEKISKSGALACPVSSCSIKQ